MMTTTPAGPDIASLALSRTTAGSRWVSKFAPEDQEVAAKILDSLLLINEDEMASDVLTELDRLRVERNTAARPRIGLYAEREVEEPTLFDVQLVPDAGGRLRRRAVGLGPHAVRPIRGARRVGSEGAAAFLLSQAKKQRKKSYTNHPSPAEIRKLKIGLIVIVTDFIGSGSRVTRYLDKLWKVPSVKSWHSRGWIEFAIVACAATRRGVDVAESHAAKPIVRVAKIVPVISAENARQAKFLELLEKYSTGNYKSSALGYLDTAALVAFSYGMPNNVPGILHGKGRGIRPLYHGHIPAELRQVFRMKPSWTQWLRNLFPSAQLNNILGRLSNDLTEEEATVALVLAALRGRARGRVEIELAEKTGLEVSAVQNVLDSARQTGLIGLDGRITDAGNKLLQAATKRNRKRPLANPAATPYYPKSLRI